MITSLLFGECLFLAILVLSWLKIKKKRLYSYQQSVLWILVVNELVFTFIHYRSGRFKYFKGNSILLLHSFTYQISCRRQYSKIHFAKDAVQCGCANVTNIFTIYLVCTLIVGLLFTIYYRMLPKKYISLHTFCKKKTNDS